MFGFLKKIFGSAHDRLIKKYFKIAAEVNRCEEKLHALSDEQLRAKTQEFRERLKKGESLDSLLPEAYAVVKNSCRRLCGTPVHVSGYDQQWDMIPYDVQLVGAIAMHYGSIAEMQTGEGKTLTAVLPLYLNALTGKPVHLVTVNDYLAQRDCQWVGSILRWLGLTTGALTGDTPPEQRHAVYDCDVVYGTSSEFGFDYLRDNSMAMHKDEQVQRGFYFAIIDEVDSILIDEARTPLIISGPVPVSKQLYGELKGGVADLVRKQRELCNRLASEAKKALEKIGALNEGEEEEEESSTPKRKLSKEEEAIELDALRKLWLVGKGTPNNKILKRIKEDPDMRAALDKMDLHYYAEQNKDERLQAISDLYIVVDERSNEYELTDKGIAAWAQGTQGVGQAQDFVMLDISHEYLKIDANPALSEEEKIQERLKVQEQDALRKERAHNLRQLLRAHLLMEKDVDYIIQDSKIVIIDENTGRAQPGRRFSDGLHQAIEAKEMVPIQKETQTYATITLQNFFRMYEKLSGMTGTAMTEANELKQIYKLDVLEIPTHRPSSRNDANDEIYMTEREKYNAILKEVREVHGKGRPILIGTESVEISEKLARIFRQNKLEHTVLNAKQNASEAEVIANAGKRGAITVATNMAGRGTDIKLEKGVAEIGGLHVIGTTRHQSRRIDRQLRGRCARQGDPGTTKFYVSFEDALLRLFASPKMNAILQRFRPPEGEPISARILNKSIETAQKRIEQRNYMMRKHTLEYDDVMNKQRQEIYTFRNQILRNDDIFAIATDLLESVCSLAAEKYFRNRSEEGGWDPEGYRQWLISHFPVSFEEGIFDQDHLEISDIEKMAAEKVIHAFKEKIEWEGKKVPLPPPGLANLQEPIINRAVRDIIIRKLDALWKEHLLAMDHLRNEVNLRSVGQRDPLMEFKMEAFKLFEELSRNLRYDIAQQLFKFKIIGPDQMAVQMRLQELLNVQLETHRSLAGEMEKQSIMEKQPPATADTSRQNGEPVAEGPKPEPIVIEAKSGRNEACPCGSGKKYKKCCGTEDSNNE
jgi:preprotein translocase subunit SecA